MPHAAEFDDVHMALVSAVRPMRAPCAVDCLRLDDDQRGGRIVGHLEQELRERDMCVADLRGRSLRCHASSRRRNGAERRASLVSDGEIDLHVISAYPACQ
jgi:hypothetical protein